MCIYIGKIQVFTNTQPNGSILFKMFNTTCIYKEVYYTIRLKRKVHTKLRKKIHSSCPAHTKATRTTQPEKGKRESDE